MSDCIFCKIINGEIPSYKIYEDEYVLAFLDLSQTTKGHTLIIPKQHVNHIFDMDDQTASHLFANVPKISRALQQTFSEMVGINIVNNNGEAAGQTVFHSHIHLIPRYDDDDFNIQFNDHQLQYTPEELATLANHIQKEVSA